MAARLNHTIFTFSRLLFIPHHCAKRVYSSKASMLFDFIYIAANQTH